VTILGHGFTDRHDSVDIRSGCDSCVGGDYSYLYPYINMSWQSYVDDQLIAQGFKQALLAGHDGNAWATSPGFGLKAGEGAAIVSIFKTPANAFASGITVNGVKYLSVKADERSLYGKKGNGGVVIVKTGQAVVIGVYDEKLQPGNAALIVEKLADYLIENSY